MTRGHLLYFLPSWHDAVKLYAELIFVCICVFVVFACIIIHKSIYRSLQWMNFA